MQGAKMGWLTQFARRRLKTICREQPESGGRPRPDRRTPAPERLEDRLALSSLAGGEFAPLGPFSVHPGLPPGQGDLPAVPAVGRYDVGGVRRPFIAVTYVGDGGGVFVLLPD